VGYNKLKATPRRRTTRGRVSPGRRSRATSRRPCRSATSRRPSRAAARPLGRQPRHAQGHHPRPPRPPRRGQVDENGDHHGPLRPAKGRCSRERRLRQARLPRRAQVAQRLPPAQRILRELHRAGAPGPFLLPLSASRDQVAKEVESLLTAAGLGPKRTTPAKALSGGMERKLSISMAQASGSQVAPSTRRPSASASPRAATSPSCCLLLPLRHHVRAVRPSQRVVRQGLHVQPPEPPRRTGFRLPCG
jgi:hypothetical protein